MKMTLNATITIEGSNIKSIKDCQQALDVALGCYEDMDDTDTSISINIQK